MIVGVFVVVYVYVCGRVYVCLRLCICACTLAVYMTVDASSDGRACMIYLNIVNQTELKLN